MAADSAANDEQLRYPSGRFRMPAQIVAAQRSAWVTDIEHLPGEMRSAVADLDDTQLATPYREGGWTVRQVVHHVPDSHMNSYMRFRLALTEDNPLIKPYEEADWAELSDAKSAPIEISLALLDALHRRWALLLRSLTDAQFARTFQHPVLGPFTLERSLALYAWHGKHHVAQIIGLRARQGW